MNLKVHTINPNNVHVAHVASATKHSLNANLIFPPFFEVNSRIAFMKDYIMKFINKTYQTSILGGKHEEEVSFFASK